MHTLLWQLSAFRNQRLFNQMRRPPPRLLRRSSFKKAWCQKVSFRSTCHTFLGSLRRSLERLFGPQRTHKNFYENTLGVQSWKWLPNLKLGKFEGHFLSASSSCSCFYIFVFSCSSCSAFFSNLRNFTRLRVISLFYAFLRFSKYLRFPKFLVFKLGSRLQFEKFEKLRILKN